MRQILLRSGSPRIPIDPAPPGLTPSPSRPRCGGLLTERKSTCLQISIRANRRASAASHYLRRAVFFHRRGEIRGRTLENQSFRASGLSLITAAIIYRNTVYRDQAPKHLRTRGAGFQTSTLPMWRAPRLGTHIANWRLRLG